MSLGAKGLPILLESGKEGTAHWLQVMIIEHARDRADIPHVSFAQIAA